jgi:alkylation response protein AidB-like acyl-CoA dehydrogenase
MLTDEQTQIRDPAQIFARADIVPFAPDWDRDHGAPRSIYRAMAEVGLMGVTIDPRYGGSGSISFLTPWRSKKLRLILLLGMASMAVMACPLLWQMHHPDTTMILTGQIAFAAICALFMSGLPAAMTEMFPHNVRVSAVSVGYNLTYAIFRRHGPYRCPLAG